MENRFRIDHFAPPLDSAWLLKATQGALNPGGEKSFGAVVGITTDSRLVGPGDCFVPLKGQSADGHQHIAHAVRAGAKVIVCHHGTTVPTGCVAIFVNDTLKALGDIARTWRQQFVLPIAAITGSNGKTTTKELITNIFSQAGDTLATWKNWNNWIGVPLTLLQLRQKHRFAVIEMGMNSFGEIAHLVHLSQPNIRLITNIMPVHLEGVGNIDGVCRAKAELLEGIGAEQTFVVNADDPRVAKLAEGLTCQKVTYSQTSTNADLHLKQVESLGRLGYNGELSIRGKLYPFSLPLSGRHNLSNMLAAIGAAISANVRLDTILGTLAQIRPAEMRSEWLELNEQILVYNDCYNANPGSMRAALEAATQVPAKRHVAVLGDMWELGQSSAAGHEEVLQTANHLGFEMIFCLGSHFQTALGKLKLKGWGRAYTSIEALTQELGALTRSGDLILVKGSRAMQMERATQHLQNLYGKDEG